MLRLLLIAHAAYAYFLWFSYYFVIRNANEYRRPSHCVLLGTTHCSRMNVIGQSSVHCSAVLGGRKWSSETFTQTVVY